jgi:hypothetical protein
VVSQHTETEKKVRANCSCTDAFGPDVQTRSTAAEMGPSTPYRTLTFQCRSLNRKTDNRTSAFLEEEVHDKDMWGCTAFSRCFKMQALAHS